LKIVGIIRPAVLAALAATQLAGCGQKGPLYMPEEATQVITRPTQTPPAETEQAPNTPQSVDTPPGARNPAPEVTAPPADEGRKESGATTPK